MSKTIYKFLLPVTDFPIIEMPVNAQILTVQTQREQPHIWALVDEEYTTVRRIKFRVLGTGHRFDDNQLYPIYVGTFQLSAGSLVFHVFRGMD